MHTPTLALLVTQPSPVQQLLDPLRRLRAGTTLPQRDEDVRSIAKQLLTKRRYKGAEHLLAVAFDALARNGRLEDAERFGHTWNALMRDRHAALHGTTDFESMSLADVHLAEEETQGIREVAETRFSSTPTEANLIALLDAVAAHERATQTFVAFLHYLAVGGQERIDRRVGRSRMCA